MADITGDDLESRLERILQQEEPRLIRWVRRTWNDQSADITDDQLRRAIIAGEVPEEWAQVWSEHYADFVNERLGPRWFSTAANGAMVVEDGLDELGYAMDEASVRLRIERWVVERSGDLVTNFTQSQQRALRVVLRYHVVNDPLSEKELINLLRPLIGLTQRQAESLRRLRAALAEDGLSESRIRDLVARAAARKRRIRAQRIARTELAMAYNRGTHAAIEDTRAAGIFEGPVRKKWRTAKDERVCPICKPLGDGDAVPLDTTFDPGGYDLPPAHPMCRCVVQYIEEEADG